MPQVHVNLPHLVDLFNNILTMCSSPSHSYPSVCSGRANRTLFIMTEAPRACRHTSCVSTQACKRQTGYGTGCWYGPFTHSLLAKCISPNAPSVNILATLRCVMNSLLTLTEIVSPYDICLAAPLWDLGQTGQLSACPLVLKTVLSAKGIHYLPINNYFPSELINS